MLRVPIVREALTRQRTFSSASLIVLASIAIPTLLRWALSGVAPNLTFVTYFPAVLISTLLVGWKAGAITAVISGILAAHLFLPQAASTPTVLNEVVVVLVYLMSCAVIVASASALRRALQQLSAERTRSDFLNRELQHRVSNTLTVISALAAQTAKHAQPEHFVDSLRGRIDALAGAHRLLSRSGVPSLELGAVVREACAPFVNRENFVISGPDYTLSYDTSVALTMAVHELCTNALKHGALGADGGRVNIKWWLDPVGQSVTLEWHETGGPPVHKPARSGFGSKLLRSQNAIPDIEVDYDPEGVRCTMTIKGVAPDRQ